MYKIIMTETYEKRAKKILSKHKDLQNQYKKTLELLSLNPYHPSLRLHKFYSLYSVSINMQYRIAIEFLIDDKTIIPITVGSHRDVYDME